MSNLLSDTLHQWQAEIASRQQAAPHQTLTFADHQQAARELGKRVAQVALSQQLADLGAGYENRSRRCAGGARQRFQRYSWRTVRTAIGEVRHRRAYYRCRQRHASSVPRLVGAGGWRWGAANGSLGGHR